MPPSERFRMPPFVKRGAGGIDPLSVAEGDFSNLLLFLSCPVDRRSPLERRPDAPRTPGISSRSVTRPFPQTDFLPPGTKLC